MPRPPNLEGPDKVAVAEANYLAAWKLLVQLSNGGSVEETDQVMFTIVPAPIAYFNSAFVKPGVDPTSCLEPVKAFYAVRDKPFTLRFRESAAAAATCQGAGLVPAGQSPLMNVATAEVEPAMGLEVRPVDAGTWNDHLRAIAVGFGMPPKLVAGMFLPTLLDGDHYAAFNAYIAGEVVSTAALIVTDGIAGIYNVA